MGSFYGNAVSAVNSQSGGAYLVNTEMHIDEYNFISLELLDSWENIVQKLNDGPVIAKYHYSKEIDETNTGTDTGEEAAASIAYEEEGIVYLPIYAGFIISYQSQGSSAPSSEFGSQVFGLQVGWLQEDEETISTSFEIKQAATNQPTSHPVIVISEGERVPITPNPGGGEIINPAL